MAETVAFAIATAMATTHHRQRLICPKSDLQERPGLTLRAFLFLAGAFAAFAHPFLPLCPPLCPPVVSETFLTFSQLLERRKT